MENYYPLPAFHFSVDFLNVKGEGSTPLDCRFSSVKGLKIINEMGESKEEAGLPFLRPNPTGKRKYGSVTLSRGFTQSSDLITWFNGAAYNAPIKPVPVLISLLNEKHKPVISWLLYETFLESWEYGGFDAMSNQYFMETIILSYTHFKEIINDSNVDLRNVIDISNNLT
ncbi:MAG: phage tail protein [Prolixibacteraceae bacterium]|nr:phage tail protein [Prolixibacteraceae bacterium]